ncbi:MAG: hypothetical protein MO852_00780 [Candidatus Devosia euplotis]|nr:hypothetical protein [Candidatus Devosia euplotis]
MIERRAGRWFTSLRVVAYDHDATVAQAVANGFAGWQELLTSGWARFATF